MVPSACLDIPGRPHHHPSPPPPLSDGQPRPPPPPPPAPPPLPPGRGSHDQCSRPGCQAAQHLPRRGATGQKSVRSGCVLAQQRPGGVKSGPEDHLDLRPHPLTGCLSHCLWHSLCPSSQSLLPETHRPLQATLPKFQSSCSVFSLPPPPLPLLPAHPPHPALSVAQHGSPGSLLAGGVILIQKIRFLKLLYGFKLFHFVHWFPSWQASLHFSSLLGFANFHLAFATGVFAAVFSLLPSCWLLLLLTLVRIILLPLLLFANIFPDSRTMPVLLTWDWTLILTITLSGLLAGYLTTATFLSSLGSSINVMEAKNKETQSRGAMRSYLVLLAGTLAGATLALAIPPLLQIKIRWQKGGSEGALSKRVTCCYLLWWGSSLYHPCSDTDQHQITLWNWRHLIKSQIYFVLYI